jgi:hypothetical protein
LSASPWISLKFSALPSARHRNHAGRRLQVRPIALAAETETKRVCCRQRDVNRLLLDGAPLAAGRGWNEATRTSPRLLAGRDSTVAIALPAYTGRGSAWRIDRHDVGKLRRAEQRRNARHQVLAEGGRGTEHECVSCRELRELRREDGGERRLVRGILHEHDARDARDPAAESATAAPSAASTATVTSASGMDAAQATHFATAAFSLPPACSATTRMRFIRRAPAA